VLSLCLQHDADLNEAITYLDEQEDEAHDDENKELVEAALMPTNPEEELRQEEEQHKEQTHEEGGTDGLMMQMLDLQAQWDAVSARAQTRFALQARFEPARLQRPNDMLAQRVRMHNEEHGVEYHDDEAGLQAAIAASLAIVGAKRASEGSDLGGAALRRRVPFLPIPPFNQLAASSVSMSNIIRKSMRGRSFHQGDTASEVLTRKDEVQFRCCITHFRICCHKLVNA